MARVTLNALTDAIDPSRIVETLNINAKGINKKYYEGLDNKIIAKISLVWGWYHKIKKRELSIGYYWINRNETWHIYINTNKMGPGLMHVLRISHSKRQHSTKTRIMCVLKMQLCRFFEIGADIYIKKAEQDCLQKYIAFRFLK